jgi:hypothetical protein
MNIATRTAIKPKTVNKETTENVSNLFSMHQETSKKLANSKPPLARRLNTDR